MAFFFMLSGFMLAHGYTAKVSQDSFSYPGFIRRRLWRVYPSHIICLFAAAVVMPWVLVPIKDFIPSIFLIQSWFADRSIYFGGNGVAWFLSDILFFYLLFPPLCRLAANIARKGRITVTLILIVGIYSLTAAGIPADKVNRWLYVFPPSRIIDCFFGIILYQLYLRTDKTAKPRRSRAGILETGTLLLVAAAYPLYSLVPPQVRTASLFWLPSAAVIMAFSLTENNAGPIGRFLQTRVMQRLGALSFEIFLVHMICILGIGRVCRYYGLEADSVIILCTATILSVAAAFPLNYISQKIYTLATSR